jgi:formylglycine-generating enzyme required for sulfatase activity
MDEMDKYYQVLGLKPGASEKEIVEAYKVLVKVWNPDRFSDDPGIQRIAIEKIKEIDEAFKQLLIWAGSPPQKEKEIPEPQIEGRTEPPETKGGIVIQTEPEGAVIAINGELVGISPYEGVKLPSGYYKVRATLQKYEIWEKDVYVKAAAKQEVLAKLKLKEPESGQIWKDPYLGMEFVYVKGGVFQMGDTFGDGFGDERPVHEVYVNAFWIGKFVVTSREWEKLIGNIFAPFTNTPDFAVCRLSWNDVQKFIHRLNQETKMNFRLPTEAEWEYAARSGGKIEKWAGTSNDSDLGAYAWYASNSRKEIHPVGQKKPNWFGLYDMTGNVFEWVQDWYGREYYNESPKNNPQGPESGVGRVLRGGSVNSFPVELRVTSRTVSNPEEGRNDIGFRLVLPAQPERPHKEEKEQPITSGETYSTPQPKATHLMEVRAQIESEGKKSDIPTPSLHKPLYKPPKVQGDGNLIPKFLSGHSIALWTTIFLTILIILATVSIFSPSSLTGLFYFLGVWLGYFIAAFILMGIVYLTGWRNSPKWKARFWWITFVFAGIICLMISISSEDNLRRGGAIIGFFLFIIVALIIWGIKRGRTTPAKEV